MCEPHTALVPTAMSEILKGNSFTVEHNKRVLIQK